jgi:hypothetical protein
MELFVILSVPGVNVVEIRMEQCFPSHQINLVVFLVSVFGSLDHLILYCALASLCAAAVVPSAKRLCVCVCVCVYA